MARLSNEERKAIARKVEQYVRQAMGAPPRRLIGKAWSPWIYDDEDLRQLAEAVDRGNPAQNVLGIAMRSWILRS